MYFAFVSACFCVKFGKNGFMCFFASESLDFNVLVFFVFSPSFSLVEISRNNTLQHHSGALRLRWTGFKLPFLHWLRQFYAKNST